MWRTRFCRSCTYSAVFGILSNSAFSAESRGWWWVTSHAWFGSYVLLCLRGSLITTRTSVLRLTLWCNHTAFTDAYYISHIHYTYTRVLHITRITYIHTNYIAHEIHTCRHITYYTRTRIYVLYTSDNPYLCTAYFILCNVHTLLHTHTICIQHKYILSPSRYASLNIFLGYFPVK